jgi:antitoxin component YwqK of YwqJK toxin-antitoxin module
MKEYKVKIEGLKEEWFENNQLVKEIDYYNNGQKEYEAYYLNNKWHREDGPAIQFWYQNGQKEYEAYYLNNKFHRENGPACQGWYENGQKEYEEYLLNDKLHRENGHAKQCWYEDGQKKYEFYYLNGKNVSKEEVMNTPKTINIGGKEVSEETILIALKNYFK